MVADGRRCPAEPHRAVRACASPSSPTRTRAASGCRPSSCAACRTCGSGPAIAHRMLVEGLDDLIALRPADRRHAGVEPPQLLRPVRDAARLLHGAGAVGEAAVLPGARELLLRPAARHRRQRGGRRRRDVPADLPPDRAPRAQRRRARPDGRDRPPAAATCSACTPRARAARAPIRTSSCRRSPASASSR